VHLGDLVGEPARSITDLRLSVVTPDPDSYKAEIVASASVDGADQSILLVRGFGNRGAASNYLQQHETTLTDRAKALLSGRSVRPD
jgi:hypothetical protein